MKILFVIPTYKPAYIYGGPIVVMVALAESLAAQGHEVTIYTTTANGKEELDVEANLEIDLNGVKVFYFKRMTKDHSHISPGLWKKIFFNVKKFDIVHLHSWWNIAIIVATLLCRIRGVQPVLSPHGMFCRYVINKRNAVAKKYFHSFVGKFLLKNTFLHVSTAMEWSESQEIVRGGWKGVVIPNLVELSSIKKSSISKEEPFIIGFISRIDPKKGLDILIKALANVRFNYKLLIAGTGNAEYLSMLKELAIHCGNSDKIEWVGWKGTHEKFKFYSKLNLFALTSHDENFAAVVIESLSVGTPVFVSNRVGLSEYVKQKELGWVTEIDHVHKVTTQLEQIFSEKAKQLKIASSAPEIIRKDYDKEFLTGQYINYYQELISDGAFAN